MCTSVRRNCAYSCATQDMVPTWRQQAQQPHRDYNQRLRAWDPLLNGEKRVSETCSISAQKKTNRNMATCVFHQFDNMPNKL